MNNESNYSLNSNSSKDSLGIELQDENSVVYIPNDDTEETDDDESHEIKEQDREQDGDEDSTASNVTVIANTTLVQEKPETSRKRSLETSNNDSEPDNKRIRYFASVSSPKDNNEAKNAENQGDKRHENLVCSTPVITVNTARTDLRLEGEEISPICKPESVKNLSIVQTHPKNSKDVAEPAASNKKCTCNCKNHEIKEADIPPEIRQFLSAENTLENLKKIINLGEAFERYQLELKKGRNTSSTNVVDGTSESTNNQVLSSTTKIRTYSNVETFVTDNIHYETGNMHRLSGLKPIVIDACNIAMAHGHDRDFSVFGLQICINFFQRREHRVYAFIPAHKLRAKDCGGVANARRLNDLVRRGFLFATPSWEAGGRRYCAYDDRIMLQAAAAIGAIVVSRDLFRDLRKEDSRFEQLLKRNLLVPTFVDNMLIFPQDPLGRRGPKLDQFLRFP